MRGARLVLLLHKYNIQIFTYMIFLEPYFVRCKFGVMVNLDSNLPRACHFVVFKSNARICKCFFVFFMLFLSCNSFKRIEYSSLYSCSGLFRSQEINKEGINWHLIVLSSASCGYCYILKRDVQKHRLYDYVKITYIEYDLKNEIFNDIEKGGLYANCEVISGDYCGKYTDFFPVILLYSLKQKNSRPKYIEKGVDRSTVRNIIAFVSKWESKSR